MTARNKYVRKDNSAAPVIVPAPAQLIQGGFASASLRARVRAAKFADHLLLYWRERIFARHNIKYYQKAYTRLPLGSRASLWRHTVEREFMMTNKSVIVLGALAAVVIAFVIWWRGRPLIRARRMLTKAAATASVKVDDGDITRRMKVAELRNYIGYELYVDVKGVAELCDLTRDEVLSAWVYVVGRGRYLSVDIQEIEVLSVDDDKMLVGAVVGIESNYQSGRYSKTYPVVMELITVERQPRIISLKTKL